MCCHNITVWVPKSKDKNIMKQKREEIEPLQIELEQFDNDVGNVSPSKSVGSTNRRKSAGLLVFLLVLICVVLSVSVVSYLISDTDQK
jgi:uncharacterized protein YpmB